MSSYLNITVNYDKQALLDLYNSSEKRIDVNGASTAILGNNFFNTGEFASILEQLPFVPQADDSFQLAKLNGDTIPHVSPNNSFVVMLPVQGSITYKSYGLINVPISLLSNSDVGVDTTIVDKPLQTIYPFESIEITSPTVVKTDTLFSTHALESIVLLVKVPNSKLLTDVIEEMQWDQILNQL